FLSGLSDKRLQLLKQAFPGVQKVAVLTNPKSAISVSELPKAEIAAARIGIHLLSLAVSTPAELRALAPTALSGSDGILVMPDAVYWNNRATIIDLASKARVPAIYPERICRRWGAHFVWSQRTRAFPPSCRLCRSHSPRC